MQFLLGLVLGLLLLSVLFFLVFLIGFAVYVIWQSRRLLLNNWIDKENAEHEMEMAKLNRDKKYYTR